MAKKTVVDGAEAQAPVAQTPQPNAEAPSLALQDIQNILKIIDFAADQGVFKGWTTIQQVFTVREKVAAFVEFAQTNMDEEAPTAST